MRLETDRLILRSWYDSDAEELYKYAIVMPKNCISMPKTHRWGQSQGGHHIRVWKRAWKSSVLCFHTQRRMPLF